MSAQWRAVAYPYKPHGWYVEDADGSMIAERMTREQAHLIAAAPAMLAALKDVYKHQAKGHMINCGCPICQIDDLIAKAEGRE